MRAAMLLLVLCVPLAAGSSGIGLSPLSARVLEGDAAEFILANPGSEPQLFTVTGDATPREGALLPGERVRIEVRAPRGSHDVVFAMQDGSSLRTAAHAHVRVMRRSPGMAMAAPVAALAALIVWRRRARRPAR
ncbi:hypothetical protein J4439_05035 [Candidatus Woesearchaeota archaeon]|nr:hypothetical protein [Candidatus Woesearchaeota archaeon]